MTQWLRRGFLPLALALLVTAAFVVPMPVFIERPGQLLSLAGCIEVETPEAEPVDGDYLLTSINLRRGTVADLVLAATSGEAQLVPAQQLIPPGEDEREYFARQRRIFTQAAQRAAALGLAAAGFDVDREALTGEGALVVRVMPGTPADGVLVPGDIITEADGRPVRTGEDLQELVGDEPLEVRFTRDGGERTVELTPRPMEVEGETRPVIGVQIQTYNERIELPVPVEVESGRIGGPSAGLMIALTVYDKVDDDDLASGRRIAGTGTVSPEGVVGTIGGIGLKALSADRHGADVFLAPSHQLEDAKALLPASSDLEVLAVNTFDNAVLALRSTAEANASPVAAPEECPLQPAA